MYASRFQRAMTYIIDFAIIGTVASLLSQLIYLILPIDMSVMTTHLEIVMEEYQEIMAAIADGSVYDTARMFEHLTELVKYTLIDLAVTSVIYLLLIVGYLIILPIYWDKQTIGRMVMKVKVVALDGGKATTKHIILRELVGTYILYILLGGIVLFVSMILAIVKDRSLVDYVSKTNLVSTIDAPDDVKHDYIDADAKEVNDDEFVEARFVDSTDDTNPSNSSDDEYKII